MTLDGQRKVMTSLEPALALELLLLNLTSLPDLINLEAMTGPMPGTGPAAGQGGGQTPPRPSAQQHGSSAPAAGGQRLAPPPQRQAPPRQAGQPPMSQAPRQGQQGRDSSGNEPSGNEPSGNEPSGTEPSGGPDDPRPGYGASPRTIAPAVQESAPPSYDDGPDDMDCPDAQDSQDTGGWHGQPDLPQTSAMPVARPSGPRDWAGFLDFVAERNGQAGVRVAMLRLTEGRVGENELVIRCKSRMHCSQLSENMTLSALGALTREYFGPKVEVRVETGDIAVPKTDRQLQEEAENHPGVLKVMEAFSAQMLSVGQRRQ
jgi:DNA polymerase-3 subunit gamma/tau